MRSTYDAIVIGSGIAGLTASRHLARQGLSVSNIEAGLFGGLVININELEGEYHGSGADLASTLMMEAGELGCATVAETVTGLEFRSDRVQVMTEAGMHEARAVILATGAKLKRLGVPGEAELEGRGVSQCADCDGPIFKRQDVVVVGGGDSALQEAHVLSGYCANVHIVHHGPELTARSRWVDMIAQCANVFVHARSEVEAIEGEDKVCAVRLRALDGRAMRTIPCAGVFVYVGLQPATEYLRDGIHRDGKGAVLTDGSMRTSIRNVFAAGAVRAGHGGTLTDTVADAERAAETLLDTIR